MLVRAAVVVFLCAVSVFASRADAQYFGRNKVRHDRLDFRILRTEHFDIYYYEEEESATHLAAKMAERWYSRFSRLLDHRFTRRQPLVLYASHPHFAQTNVTSEALGEGTGGLTERTKSRIAMPFAAGLGETDHVLGHEIAHAFQIDIAKAAHQSAFALPGWVIEGMAEYLSLGPANANTVMWLRDAAFHKRLPALRQLNDARFFPYRYGHALWSYLASRFGDGVLRSVLTTRTRGILPRLEDVTGLSEETLTRDWHESVASERAAWPTGVPAPRMILTARADAARLHVAPALSPDGRYLMFLSERDRLSLDLFMADASTGRVVKKIVSTAADPHFDSLQYIHSAGSWDPTGRRFVLTAVSGGESVLMIVGTTDAGPRSRQEIRLPAIGEAYSPTWSPDGTRIAFSGLKGGFSDLFVYDLRAGVLQQLTDDAFADLQPAWSSDGRGIAFATDRFTTTMDTLRFGALRIGIIDVESRQAVQIAPDPSGAKQINPQWAPGGEALYFVSDRDGVSNVFRLQLGTAELRQVTADAAGVSGITATSPALAVASDAGTVAFSVYRNGRYEIQTVDGASAAASLVVSPLPEAPSAPAPAAETLAAILADPLTGLPADASFSSASYDDRLQLESMAQPYIGATTGSAFGGVVRAHVGFTFGDMLRDRQLQTTLRVGTSVNDFAVQAAYTNRHGRWDWGFSGGFVPSRFVDARQSLLREDGQVTRETSHLQYSNQWAGLAARYNIDRARRFDLRGGVRRTGVEWQTVRQVTDSVQQKTLSVVETETPAGKPVYLAEAQAAFVRDTAVFGAVSPVLGDRLRVEVEPAIGAVTYADVRVDLRRYMMPLRPVTVAMRLEHVGRYGAGATDARLTPLVMGLQTLVRGYDLRSYAEDECGRTATSCSLLDELSGSRIGVFNLELRAPLVGLLNGEVDYGSLPVEAIAFADAGMLWTRHAGEPVERDRFRSVGIGARANLGGIVLEMTAARPFDRATEGWTLNLLFSPAF